MIDSIDIKILIGKKFSQIFKIRNDIGLLFIEDYYQSPSSIYLLKGDEDCCNDVYIESIDGDINDLVDSIIVEASEESNNDSPATDRAQEEYLWTFYKIRSEKGYVTIRFFGTSNGYYSENATLYEYK